MTKKRKTKLQRKQAKRNWHKPAGAKVNKIIDDFEQNLASDRAMDLRVAIAKGATRRLLGHDRFLVAVLPGVVNLGIHALTTGDYEMQGQTLEGEALETFKKDWEGPSADVAREAESRQKEHKD